MPAPFPYPPSTTPSTPPSTPRLLRCLRLVCVYEQEATPYDWVYTPDAPTVYGSYTPAELGPEWVVLEGSDRQVRAVPQVGEHVYGRIGVNFYLGWITQVHRKGTISVEFEDGACNPVFWGILTRSTRHNMHMHMHVHMPMTSCGGVTHTNDLCAHTLLKRPAQIYTQVTPAEVTCTQKTSR